MPTYQLNIELKSESLSEAWATLHSQGFPRDFSVSSLENIEGYTSISLYEDETGREVSVTLERP